MIMIYFGKLEKETMKQQNLIGRGYLEDIHLGVVPPKLWQVFAGTLNSKVYFTLVDVVDLTFIG